VWASGSHVCNGKIGTLIANEAAKARKSQRAVDSASELSLASVTTSKVSTPVSAWCRNARVRMPTSISADPVIV
jgi:hypothetical protein